MHLFVSFILKAVAVFIKDVVLYEVGEVDNCATSSVSPAVKEPCFFFFLSNLILNWHLIFDDTPSQIIFIRQLSLVDPQCMEITLYSTTKYTQQCKNLSLILSIS